MLVVRINYGGYKVTFFSATDKVWSLETEHWCADLSFPQGKIKHYSDSGSFHLHARMT